MPDKFPFAYCFLFADKTVNVFYSDDKDDLWFWKEGIKWCGMTGLKAITTLQKNRTAEDFRKMAANSGYRINKFVEVSTVPKDSNAHA